jgi:hypothetical protein
MMNPVCLAVDLVILVIIGFHVIWQFENICYGHQSVQQSEIVQIGYITPILIVIGGKRRSLLLRDFTGVFGLSMSSRPCMMARCNLVAMQVIPIAAIVVTGESLWVSIIGVT